MDEYDVNLKALELAIVFEQKKNPIATAEQVAETAKLFSDFIREGGHKQRLGTSGTSQANIHGH